MLTGTHPVPVRHLAMDACGGAGRASWRRPLRRHVDVDAQEEQHATATVNSPPSLPLSGNPLGRGELT